MFKVTEYAALKVLNDPVCVEMHYQQLFYVISIHNITIKQQYK